MRTLGVDHGLARIGLAVSDQMGISARPLPTLEVKGLAEEEVLRRLAAVAREAGAEGIVLGLPVNMDGTEGPAARRVRAFGARLAEAAGLPLEYHDERLTTHAAEEALREMGCSVEERRARSDAVSAQLILRGYFDEKGKGGTE